MEVYEAMGSAGGIAFFHAPAVYSEGRHFRAEYSWMGDL